MLAVSPAAEPLQSPALSIDHLQPLASGCRPPDERHIVADTAGGRHRLCIRGEISDTALNLAIPVDAAMPLRLDAASRLTADRTSAAYHPTRQQRIRLILLLRLLDAEQDGLSRRDIAETLIYPRNRRLQGAAWKASSERRRTHRLIREAQRLRDQGVVDLLHARLRPAG